MAIKNEQQEYLAHIRERVDAERGAFDSMIRRFTSDGDAETLARIENALGAAAPKGEALDALLDEASSAEPEEWEGTRDRVDAAWNEYREVIERARMEMERAGELT
jgi:Arc/MetJ family transcription regulator